MAAPVYVLGGYQTDFARNWTKESKHIVAMMREATKIDPGDSKAWADLGMNLIRSGNEADGITALQRHLGAFSSMRIRPSPVCHVAPRGRLRLRLDRDPRRLGRDRGRALRPGHGGRGRADEDRRPQAGRRLPRHRRLVRPRSEGRGIPLPQAVRPPRRRVRQALRPEGRAPRAHLRGQLLERQAQPAGADAQLVHDRGARERQR